MNMHSETTLPMAWYALATLTIAGLFGVIDRQIFVLVTEPMKHDLAITDTQIGLMQSLGPALFAAAAAIPLGWCADRFERRIVLIACILFWTVATGACGLVETYPQLLVASIAIGVGEAALIPIAYSLIPDLFSEQQRVRANLIYYACAMIGGGLGLTLGGWVLNSIGFFRQVLPAGWQTLADWRQAFLIVAVPGPIICLAVFLIGPVPRRGVAAAAAARPSFTLFGYFREHGRTVVTFYVAGGLFSVAVGAIAVWAAVAAIRVLGAPAGDVGVALGLALGAGSLTGVGLASRSLGFWTRRVGECAPLRACSTAMLFCLVPTIALLFVAEPWQVYVLVGLFFAAGTMGIALVPTVLQDIAPGGLRARIIAISSFVSVVVGAGSPVMVGALSDVLAGQPRGLIWAIVLITAPALAISAVLFRMTETPYRQTISVLAGRVDAAA